jgi:hypothetical protein
MNANALFYCINNALNDENVVMIELFGLKHSFTLKPKKIIDVATKQDHLWITKKVSDIGIDQLLINPDQIVYVRIRKEV